MLCKNCNKPLNGSESFCPYCGQALTLPESQKDSSDKKVEENEINHSGNFEISDIPENVHCSIFDSDSIDVPLSETAEKKDKKRSKTAMTLVGLFVFILLAIALFTAVQYFDLLTPVLSYLKTDSTTEGLVSTSYSELRGDEGLLPPEINYKPEVYTVTCQGSLSLRKGPSDDYALISLVPSGMRLQITGARMNCLSWVYVYIPSLDLYGWLNAAYLTKDSTLIEGDINEKSDKINSTTESEKELEGEDNETTGVTDTHTAKVTAEKGLYLRSGPGTSFSPITVIGKNEKITVIEKMQDNSPWTYVEFEGKRGYVSSAFIDNEPDN